MRIFRPNGFVLILMMISFNIALAQHKVIVNFDKNSWDIKAKKFEFTTFKGKPALYLEKGFAFLKNSKLKNGIIDFDVSFEKERKFATLLFRIKDTKNYEQYYMRAHQSGNPDAMQYTPVFNGVSGWQLYHGKGYSNAYNFNFKEWMHVRLIIVDGKMDVFINDMSQPILHAHDLKREVIEGGIGFHSLIGGVYYANLEYTAIESPKLISIARKVSKVENSVLTNWKVSKVFNKLDLKEVHDLKNHKAFKRTIWNSLATEYDGKLNLAKATTKTKDHNTVFVKTVITSKKKQIKKLSFGYSDEVIVFVNNKIVYSGHNKFRSRDYRYLGTIGYFDTIYLELKKGKNEIVFAVSEKMGGWGLKAKVENLENIHLK
jgi:hypothetical protein